MEMNKVTVVEKARNIVLEYWNNIHACKLTLLDIHYAGYKETNNYMELSFYTSKSLGDILYRVIYNKNMNRFALYEYELVNEFVTD